MCGGGGGGHLRIRIHPTGELHLPCLSGMSQSSLLYLPIFLEEDRVTTYFFWAEVYRLLIFWLDPARKRTERQIGQERFRMGIVGNTMPAAIPSFPCTKDVRAKYIFYDSRVCVRLFPDDDVAEGAASGIQLALGKMMGMGTQKIIHSCS